MKMEKNNNAVPKRKRRTLACFKLWCIKSPQGKQLYRCLQAYKTLLIFAGAAGIAVLIIWMALFLIMRGCFYNAQASASEGRWGEAGIVGDMFGSINALFAGLSMVFSASAFLGFLLALWMQRQDLNLQRKEMQAARREMEEQTSQFSRQAEIAAIQTLHATLSTYKQRLDEAWARIIDCDYYMLAVCTESEILIPKAHEIIENRYLPKIIIANNSYKNAVDAITKLHHFLLPFFPWASIVIRWIEKVDYYITDERERVDAKKSILTNLNEKQLHIIWLCCCSCGKVDFNESTNYIPLSDFAGRMGNIYQVWIDKRPEEQRAIERVLGEVLEGVHCVETSPRESLRVPLERLSNHHLDRVCDILQTIS